MADTDLHQLEADVASFERWLGQGEEPATTPQAGNQQTPQATHNAPEEEENLLSEEDDEVAAQPAQEEGGEAADNDAEQGEENLSSLDALASYFEVEPDDVLNNIMVSDPFGKEVPIGEALGSWRSNTATLSQRQEELQREFAEQRAKNDEASAAHARKLMLVANAMIQELQTAYSDDRLEELAHSDPHRYTEAMKRKFEIAHIIDQAVNGIGEVAGQVQSNSQADMQELLRRENAKLLEKKPEWSNAAERTKAMQGTVEYLKGMDFTPEEIGAVNDHRMLLVIEDAKRYRELQQQASGKSVDALRKKGLKAPAPGLRPVRGRNPDMGGTQEKAREALRARLRKSGDIKDAAAVLGDYL